MSEKRSFWTTLPGILTGIAGIITATGGFLVILVQIGIIGPKPESVPEPLPEPESRLESRLEVKPEADLTSVTEQPKQPTGFRVVEVFLRADPINHAGPCPVTITFTGRISAVGGSGTISYKFLRSDGASAPIQTLTFDEPGSKKVSTTWRLGAPTSRFNPFKGWQAIKIFDPQEIESNKANFTITCK